MNYELLYLVTVIVPYVGSEMHVLLFLRLSITCLLVNIFNVYH
jgi:hypothetical protein